MKENIPGYPGYITLPKMVKCILIKREVGNLEKLLIALVLVVYE